MKNIVKKIAMILIIVMLVNCFTGCAELIIGTFQIIAYAAIGSLVVGAVVGLIIGIIEANRLMKVPIRRTNPYLYENGGINTTLSSLPEEELDSLSRTFSSLPEKERNALVVRLNSLSKQETCSLLESINSFSKEEFAALVNDFNSMQETEIVNSLEYLNSLPKTVSLAHVVQMDADAFREKAHEEQY